MPISLQATAPTKTSTYPTGFVGKSRKGSLLVEAMMAIVLFGLFVAASYTTLLTGQEGTRNGSFRVRSVNYTMQGLEVVRSIASQDDGYDLLTPGTHGFTIDPDSGIWVLSGSTTSRFGYQTTLYISDLSDNTKKVDVRSTWDFGYFRSGETEVSTVISNWQASPGVGDWSNITQTGSWTAGRQRNYTDAYAYKDYLYITNEGAAYGKGLTILDISNAASPSEVSGTFNLPYNTYTPVAYRDILYVAVGTTNDVRAYSIADPTGLNGATSPIATAALPGGPNRARSLAIKGSTLFVGATGNGAQSEFYTYDIQTGSVLTLLDSISITGDPTIYDIAIKDDYAYLAGASANMYIVDITDPSNLIYLNSRSMGLSQATGVRANGTGYYTTMLNGLDELTMRKGTGSGIPSASGPFGVNIGGNANGLEMDPLGCYAYIANGNGSKELQIRDATITTLPEETFADISGTGEGRAVAYNIQKDQLYMATESGVYLYTPGTGGRCGDGIMTMAGGGSSYSCPSGYEWNESFLMCIALADGGASASSSGGGGPSSFSASSTAISSTSSVASVPIVVTVTATDGSEDGGVIAFGPTQSTLLAAMAVVGGSDATFTFTADSAVSSDLTVNYSVGGTAVEGTDFDDLSGSAVISSGTSTEQVTINIADDDVVENDETILITITGLSYGSIGSPSVATAEIVSDNDSAAVSATANAAASEPGSDGSFTLSLDNSKIAGSDITVNYSVGGTATPTDDYTALGGTAVISAGNNSVIVPIEVADDGDTEGSETVTITVDSGVGYSVGSDNSETITINDDDVALPGISASAHVNLVENTTNGSVTLSVDGGSPVGSDTTVNYSIGGTATNGTDYSTLSGNATITSGNSSVVIPITRINDAIVEGTETIVITVTAGGGYNVGSDSSETINITDDDTAAVSATAHSNLAEPSTNGSFTLRLDNSKIAGSDITVNYSVGGTASGGSDYTSLSGTATISSGNSTVVVPVNVSDDPTVEGTETIIITVTGGSGYSVGSDSSETINITDNDEGGPTSPSSPSGPTSPSMMGT